MNTREPVQEREIEELAHRDGQGAAEALSTAAFSQAPWWAISVVFHGLVILLLSLITWVIRDPNFAKDNTLVDIVIVAQPDIVQVKPPAKSVLPGERDVDPTDPDSPLLDNIATPPEILAKAELGDHRETFNPEKPDTHGAFGVLDSTLFHSVSGCADPAGGGGQGGITFDEVIGMGGNASPGKGGGWGGGEGPGIGNNIGRGKGSFGYPNRYGRRLMVPKHGGSAATENAVDAGLRWLAYHQEPDGHWDAQKFGAQQKTDTACTGFALLAFLGAGHTEKLGIYKDHVRRAVAWLISKQSPEGLVWDTTDAGGHRGVGYPHAIAGMALAEAAGMARVPTTFQAAQKAIAWSCKGTYEGGEAPWRYPGALSMDKADLSVSGWFIMQLKSAKVAGLDVPKGSFEKAIKFLDYVELRVAVQDEAYGVPSEYQYQKGRWAYSNQKHRMCCIGTLSRQFLGWKKTELEASVRHFIQLGGVPSAWGETTDLYYWYYGTLCAFQQGGEMWKKWNDAMKPTFINSQRRHGDEDGSWDPVGCFASEWGRVGQTALSALCLEVYYRYLRMTL